MAVGNAVLPSRLALAVLSIRWAAAWRDDNQVVTDKVWATKISTQRQHVETMSERPSTYTPQNFRCFTLPGTKDRQICGMARPTTDENPRCGHYDKFYRGQGGEGRYCIKRINPDGSTEIMETEEDVCAFCGGTMSAFEFCPPAREKYQSQAGSIRSIMTHALRLIPKSSGKKTGKKSRKTTLYSIDHMELSEIAAAADALGIEHNTEYVVQDFTSPDGAKLNAFAEAVMNLEGNVIVHCGGGMGRTGVFLQALITRIFWGSGLKYYDNKARGEVARDDKRKPIQSWMDPLEEAIAFVQRNYHKAAGELAWVPKNYNALAELILYMADNKEISKKLNPAVKVPFGNIKGFSTTVYNRAANFMDVWKALAK
mmetsp:Transcript_99468/g.197107  ORF Transcript_99468/g.197107 Transcript_99468/m.197107 type:complete len:370 (+) Transcript_99468:130-1239(+)|eukprot:CAMPEP_0172881810 /NCGR_PEP_ID=MMETSP1075-20121228/118475_1 /TAXON_ID=2916 /ORGANISM="Ceratium fusus, Strain PA161109" /LENGTH=369 /DNA_ID=CAMNT_0013734353 /DNA_START=32 /DNA_END=1141 /DNA_ORIENTATION=-